MRALLTSSVEHLSGAGCGVADGEDVLTGVGSGVGVGGGLGDAVEAPIPKPP